MPWRRGRPAAARPSSIDPRANSSIITGRQPAEEQRACAADGRRPCYWPPLPPRRRSLGRAQSPPKQHQPLAAASAASPAWASPRRLGSSGVDTAPASCIHGPQPVRLRACARPPSEKARGALREAGHPAAASRFKAPSSPPCAHACSQLGLGRGGPRHTRSCAGPPMRGGSKQGSRGDDGFARQIATLHSQRLWNEHPPSATVSATRAAYSSSWLRRRAFPLDSLMLSCARRCGGTQPAQPSGETELKSLKQHALARTTRGRRCDAPAERAPRSPCA